MPIIKKRFVGWKINCVDPVFLVMLGNEKDPNCTCSVLIPSGEKVGNESFFCGVKFLNSTILDLHEYSEKRKNSVESNLLWSVKFHRVIRQYLLLRCQRQSTGFYFINFELQILNNSVEFSLLIYFYFQRVNFYNKGTSSPICLFYNLFIFTFFNNFHSNFLLTPLLHITMYVFTCTHIHKKTPKNLKPTMYDKHVEFTLL